MKAGAIPARAGQPPAPAKSTSALGDGDAPRPRGDNSSLIQPHLHRRHPRARGESDLFSRTGTATPPRTRGNHLSDNRPANLHSDTPAHAGQPEARPHHDEDLRRHPCDYGSNRRSWRIRRDIPGAPRATLPQIQYAGRQKRHPRARRETNSGAATRIKATSPRTREQRAYTTESPSQKGDIPAYARWERQRLYADTDLANDSDIPERGATTRRASLFPPQQHPRARGGQPGVLHWNLADRRDIPAHAGTTSYRQSPGWGSRRHPRARGDNPTRKHGAERQATTSPRTRGTCLDGTAMHDMKRHHRARETDCSFSYAGKPPRHPRARGATNALIDRNRITGVTSPRARGNRHYDRRHRMRLGDAPARKKPMGASDIPATAGQPGADINPALQTAATSPRPQGNRPKPGPEAPI